jgi:hypothetical protein
MVSRAKGSQTGSLAAAKAEADALAAADAAAIAEALAAHNMGKQLLAEEEQQKTKAAAKKARRERQKAKKQAEALKLQESKLLGSDCTALAASISSAENPDADMLSLFCCPITKVRFQDPFLHLLCGTHTFKRKVLTTLIQQKFQAFAVLVAAQTRSQDAAPAAALALETKANSRASLIAGGDGACDSCRRAHIREGCHAALAAAPPHLPGHPGPAAPPPPAAQPPHQECHCKSVPRYISLAMTAMGTGHGTQAAVADLAAVDCKTGVPSCYSQIYLPTCLCLFCCHIKTCLTPPVC